MKILNMLGASLAGLLVLCSARPKPFSYEVHPEHSSVWLSNGKVTSVSATVSVRSSDSQQAGYDRSKVEDEFGGYVKIWADKKLVFKSELISDLDEPLKIQADVNGAETIILESVSAGPWNNRIKSLIKWEDVTFKGGKGVSVKRMKDKTPFKQLGILTPAEKPEPQFNGADIWGVRPGHPVIFRVPVSGKRPMKFTAVGLPEGVSFDTEKGILGGTAPSKAGIYDIVVTAENAYGKAERSIRLQVGNLIALTPPMGWNSWNIWTHMVTAQHTKDAAVALEQSGLANYGWAYINIDDYWERSKRDDALIREREAAYGKDNIKGNTRDEKGRIIPNASFPNMKKLTDYIHSFGFKAGLYSSPGPVTCGKCEGTYGHEMEDATSWAEWGFDYIKYDFCSYRTRILETMDTSDPDVARAEYIHPYDLMYNCLKKQSRDLVFSFGQRGRGGAKDWARQYGANCFRVFSDLRDGWTWVLQALESKVSDINGEFWKYSGPGCWADPDMLVIGDQRSFGSIHPTLLTPNEQYTHISMWAMIGSPLLIGCDMTKLDAFTYNLLANPEVIAISQDRLGKVARRYVNTDTEQVWARPLANGDWAIALVNLYPMEKSVRFDLKELGLDDLFHVYDCWTCTEEGLASGRVSAKVPAHATKLIRLKRVDCPKCELISLNSRTKK